MATNNADNFSKPLSIANGGTGYTSFTTDGTLYYNGSNLVDAGTGTAGQMLISAGTGAPPFWGQPAMKLISSQTTTLNQLTVSFTGLTSAYNTYYFVCSHFASNVALAQLLMQYSTNGGSSYVSTGYLSEIPSLVYNSATFSSAGPSTNGFFMMKKFAFTTGSAYFNTWAYLFNVTNGKGCTSVGYYVGNGGSVQSGIVAGSFGNNGTAINALQCSAWTGSASQAMPAGVVFSLYGVIE